LLLEGIGRLAARHGVRRLEAEVDRTHRADFETAGWQAGGPSKLWSRSIPDGTARS
jgi:hypothetical protein